MPFITGHINLHNLLCGKISYDKDVNLHVSCFNKMYSMQLF